MFQSCFYRFHYSNKSWGLRLSIRHQIETHWIQGVLAGGDQEWRVRAAWPWGREHSWVVCLDMYLICTGVRQRVEMLLEAETVLGSSSWTPLWKSRERKAVAAKSATNIRGWG